jgi:type IV secretion system protein VirB10
MNAQRPSDGLEELSEQNLSRFDAAPQVRAPDNPWVLPLGVVGVLALGVFVFWQLSAQRARGEPQSVVGAAPGPASARPMSAPRPAPPAQALSPTAIAPPQLQSPSPPGAGPNDQARLQAPALIVDLSEAHAASGQSSGPTPQAIAGALSGDERFASRFDSSGAAHARPLEHPAATIAQGAIIAAVLETAIDSDTPGFARALVTRDVRGFDGARVLVPRGSRLIGQYRSSLSLGASRVFVIWSRLIRPDGVSIDLNSPGADALGRGGLDGETDTHFMQRFGGAILLSLIGAAGEAAAGGRDTQVVVGVSQSGQSAAAAAVGQEVAIPPTVRVAQGAPLRIFVARDLDFSSIDDAETPP